jgi:hypothetical protein
MLQFGGGFYTLAKVLAVLLVLKIGFAAYYMNTIPPLDEEQRKAMVKPRQRRIPTPEASSPASTS